MMPNLEKIKAAKRKFYASEKGKEAKRKEDLAYIVSGGRAKVEAKRAKKPLSEARIQARLKYQLKRRATEKKLCELSNLCLSEAVVLCKTRAQLLGTKWHVDHIIPVSKGGDSLYNNIQVVPAVWNRQKSNKHSNRFFKGAA
jgi:5-methylcytosine-specific restriction endonuclease McrA